MLMASTTYIGLLEGSLFDNDPGMDGSVRQTDFNHLLEGSRSLRISESTGWKWQVDEEGGLPAHDEV